MKETKFGIEVRGILEVREHFGGKEHHDNAVENLDTPAQAKHQRRGREAEKQLTLSD